LRNEAKVYPLDLMQDVISQLAENPAYKILLLRREEKIEILDALSNSKTMLSTWLGNEVTTRVGISNLDVMVSMDSGNAHIVLCW
jgi:hypothetical protein